MRIRIAMISFLCIAIHARAVTLDEIFANVDSCAFDQFWYSTWAREPLHPYLASLVPTSDSSPDQYRFLVKDSLFDLPVIELRVPGTWGFHSVTFDVPLQTARKAIQDRFGSQFPPSRNSLRGEAPALVASKTNPKQSVLYCNEPEEVECCDEPEVVE